MNTPNDMLQRILDDKPPIPPQDEGLHRALSRHFDGKRNKAVVITMLYLLVAVWFILSGIYILATATDTRQMLFGLAALVAGFEMQVLLKLWYWVIDNKISVMRSLKETQLMIIESAAPTHAGNGGIPFVDTPAYRADDLIAASFWERFNPVSVRRWTALILVLITVIATLVLVGQVSPKSSYALAPGLTNFGPVRVTQEDSWQFSSSDRMTATSLLLFSKVTEEQTMELKLPYEHAVVTSVRPYLPCDAPPLAFTMKENGAFTVQLGSTKTWQIWGISVTWTVPVDALERESDGFRVPLRALLPVYGYQLKGIVTPDAPWEIKGDPASFLFNAFRCTSLGKPSTDMGSCVISLVKKGSAPQ